ncbi:hypothetical protein SLS58_004963 [Diplodia intermedia]|uniref:Zinc finger zz-type protein n=1 Tax=Diplodia intermedia TaxID=856260 RepID=A0ABR3TSP0_9PEZI
MPTLKQLTCTLEKEPSRAPLKEFSTNYSDGFVETYVAVPIERTGFGIHLKSSGYIAPGLAMFVYIDGVYQCNRHRQNLIPPDGTVPSDFYETNFRVLQKEEKTGKGQFVGRAWSFDSLNIASADKAPNVDDTILGNLGTIEVVVLRVHPLSAQPVPAGMAAPLPARPANATKAKPTSEKTGNAAKQKVIKIKPKFVPDENGKFDGAADDAPVQNFGAGLDGPSDDRYYDRGYDYYHDHDDRGRRPRHSHHRRASPSPPPRHDFGPSYADYLRWRDTHPDAAVPSRGPVMQRSSSYYEQYRPTSGAHGQHGNANSGHRQRRRVRADDGIPLDRPYEYWVFEGSNLLIGDRFPHPAHEDPPPLSASYLTQSEYESQAKSEAERRPRTSGEARAGAYSTIDTRKLPQARASDQVSRHVRWADGYREGHVTDLVKQIPNRQTGKFSSYRAGQADTSLVSASRLDPIYNTRRAPETSRRDDDCKMPGSWVGQDPKDSARTPTPNPFYRLPVYKKQQQSGSRSNKGGPTTTFHESGNEQGGQFNGQDTTGWAGDTWDSNGAAQGGDGSKAAGDGGWGPTDPQEQPNQPAEMNFGGAQQDTGASGNWQNDAGNTGGDAGNSKWGNDNTGGEISFGPATADNSADNTGAEWNYDTTTPAANDAQQATADSKWTTPADNAQQAPDDNKWDCSAIPTPTAHVEQFPAVAKTISSHKAASSAANTSMHKPIVPEQPFVKSYWQNTTPSAPVAAPYRQPKSSPDAPTEVFAPSEAPYVVPEHTPREKLVDSYVHHGKAYGYTHATARPNYMDTLDQPYAVFRFKYRSGEMLARILGRKGKEEIEKERAREREEERKRKLSLLSKEELIAQLVEKKEAEAKAASEKKATTAGGSQQWKAPSVAASQPKSINEWVNNVVDATGSVGKASAAKSTSGGDETMTCDRCNVTLINEWWSCDKCVPGDDTYDICIHCVETKERCKDSSHDLMKMRDNVDIGNGKKGPQPVNETLRGIQKGSKSTKGGNGGGSKKNGGGGNNTAKDDSNNWSGDFVGTTGDWAGTTPVVGDTTSGGAWGPVDTKIAFD